VPPSATRASRAPLVDLPLPLPSHVVPPSLYTDLQALPTSSLEPRAFLAFRAFRARFFRAA